MHAMVHLKRARCREGHAANLADIGFHFGVQQQMHLQMLANAEFLRAYGALECPDVGMAEFVGLQR